MLNWKKAFTSTVGQKYIMALTGLALVLFLIAHLAGNLQLLQPSGELFNKYSHHLVNLGYLLYAIEVGLLLLVLVHAFIGINLARISREARPARYVMEASKGGDSRANVSSRHMVLLGLGILIFIVIHVWQFRFGPGMDEGYVVTIHGEQARDLHRLVIEAFANPAWVIFYCGMMFFVGFHARHGVWSMFQSVGAMPGGISKTFYAVGAVFAALIALGFFLLPIWIFIGVKLGVYTVGV